MKIICSEKYKNELCELSEDDGEVYLKTKNKNNKTNICIFFESYINNRYHWEYDFFHSPNYESEEDYKLLFNKFPNISKNIKLFIIQNNIVMDDGDKFFNREISNSVYSLLMKNYEHLR